MCVTSQVLHSQQVHVQRIIGDTEYTSAELIDLTHTLQHDSSDMILEEGRSHSFSV